MDSPTPATPAASPPREGGPWTYAATLKDPMLEELINWRVHRPLAFWLILKPMEHWPRRPTPNQVTFASGAAGVAGALSLLFAPTHGWWWYIVAGALLFLSVLLDCSDGMLARLTGQTSELGMLLDGIVDFVVGASFWAGMTWASGRAMPGASWLWPVSFTILLSIVLHCALYDHLRKRFSHFVSTHAPAPAPRGQRGGWLDLVYQSTYVRVSVALTGAAPDAPRPPLDAATLRQRFARPMRMASWFGLGTQLAVIYLVTPLAALWPRVPFFVALVLLAGVLNVWTVVALVAWRDAERAVADDLAPAADGAH